MSNHAAEIAQLELQIANKTKELGKQATANKKLQGEVDELQEQFKAIRASLRAVDTQLARSTDQVIGDSSKIERFNSFWCDAETGILSLFEDLAEDKLSGGAKDAGAANNPRSSDKEVAVNVEFSLNKDILNYSTVVGRTGTVGNVLRECCSFWGVSPHRAFLTLEDGVFVVEDELVYNLLAWKHSKQVRLRLLSVEDQQKQHSIVGSFTAKPATMQAADNTNQAPAVFPVNSDGSTTLPTYNNPESSREKVRVVSRTKCCNCLVYVALLFAFLFGFVLQQSSLPSFQVKTGIEQALVAKQFTVRVETEDEVDLRVLRYPDITTSLELWDWVEHPLSLLFFFNTRLLRESTPLSLGANEVVGKVRFRQVRTRENAGCSVPERATDVLDDCLSNFRPEFGDTETFGLSDTVLEGFVWQSAPSLEAAGGTGSSTGWLATYDGSGFVRDLTPRNQSEWTGSVDELRDNLWIDEKTRAFFVSFNVYNVNLNRYCLAQFMLEQDLAGQFVTSFSVMPLTGEHCFGCGASAAFDVIALLLALVVMGSMMRRLWRVMVFKQSAFNFSSWDLLDIFIVICYISHLTISLVLAGRHAELGFALWNSSDKFVYGGATYRLLQGLYFVTGLFIVLVSARLIEFVRYTKFGYMYSELYVYAGKELVVFSLIFLITVISVAFMTFWVYVPYIPETHGSFGIVFLEFCEVLVGMSEYTILKAPTNAGFNTLLMVLIVALFTSIFGAGCIVVLSTKFMVLKPELEREGRHRAQLGRNYIETNVESAMLFWRSFKGDPKKVCQGVFCLCSSKQR